MSSQANDAPNTWVAERAVTEISRGFYAAWDNYIKFYTVFLTFNIAGLAVVQEHIKDQQSRNWVCVVFILQNLIATSTTAIIGFYSVHCQRRVNVLLVSARTVSDVPEALARNCVPGQLGAWCAGTSVASLLTLVAAWIVVLASQPVFSP